ncbi:MAG: response regulator, partial [Arenimonas sp.]|nr:response regulator [Arenimonas sp.]
EDVERMARHDLKTPLNSILGASRLLLEDGRMAPEQREMASVVERAGLRMLDMVNLSLGLYRMETGSYDFRPQAVDLRELLARVLADLLPQADAAGVVLRDPGPRAPVHARAEELLCYSILANLVKNAIEATPAGGTVTVQVLPGEPVRVTVHNPGQVAAELAPRFFDKYTSTGKTGGTGLGTYSARLMARAQGGELLLHSGAAEGTTLELQLQPLLRAPQLPAQPSQLPPAPAVGLAELQPRHVLVVDDDEFTRLVMRRYLPAPTFTVRVASSGEAAMDAIRASAPQALVLDIEMPGIGGLPVLAWLRQREARESAPRCAVIVTSAHDDELTRQRALASGADRYLVKPVSREALWAALRELQDAAPRTGAPPAVAPEAGPDDVVRIEPEWAELFPEFLAAQRRTVQEMREALVAGDRERLRALAHRAAGGLALGGLRWAAAQARTLEAEAPTGDLPCLVGTVEALAAHLAVVRTQLANVA